MILIFCINTSLLLPIFIVICYEYCNLIVSSEHRYDYCLIGYPFIVVSDQAAAIYAMVRYPWTT